MRAVASFTIVLIACGPEVTSTGGEFKRDAGQDAADDSGLCDGCTQCDGGTSRDGVFCCTGCWDVDLCSVLSSDLTCGEHGAICAQCIGELVCEAGSCVAQ